MLSDIWEISVRAFINSVGLFAPGMEERETKESILLGTKIWEFQSPSKLVADMLPANERRRTTPLIKLALHVANLAIEHAETDVASLRSVYASSDGDLDIVDKLCTALSEKEKIVSPTQFHNSVHNAPAGYWAIFTKSHAPSTSISAAEATFTAGLLESMTQIAAMDKDVLLVCYDYPPPAPLDQKRDITMPYGIALLLSNNMSESTIASLHIQSNEYIGSEYIISKCQNLSLENLRQSNPAASSLPLIEAIYRKQTMNIVLPYVCNNNIKIHLKS